MASYDKVLMHKNVSGNHDIRIGVRKGLVKSPKRV